MITAVIIFTLACLAAASVTDLRTGEVPDLLSHALAGVLLLAALAFGLQAFATAFAVAAAYFTVSYLLYRAGMWAGGDVKLMGGIGASLGLLAALGFAWPRMRLLPYYLTFFADMALASLPYLIIYATILGLRSKGTFKKFLELAAHPRVLLLLAATLIPSILNLLAGFTQLALIFLTLPAMMLLSAYARAVEHTAMRKEKKAGELAEGDVLLEDIKFKGRLLASRRNLDGLTSEQAQELRKLAAAGKIPKTFTVRWGIRYAPALLIAYALTVYAGNLIEVIFTAVTSQVR